LHVEVIESDEILLSLKTWVVDHSDRWNLYRAMRVIESLKKKKKLSSLRKVINSKLVLPEKEELLSIISCVTK